MSEIASPEDAIEERFLAATGPGGQNVNKVATACQLRVDVFRLGLEPDVYRRLKTLAGRRMTGAGDLLITARPFCTQTANRAAARAGLVDLLPKAPQPPLKRRPPTTGSAAFRESRCQDVEI